jgi:GNAT superfamily N-acetyltransferase
MRAFARIKAHNIHFSKEVSGMWGHSLSRNNEMNQAYFKRYKMEISLRRASCRLSVPSGYQLLPWDEHLLDAHAFAKFHSFRDELDAHVFPCLGEEAGCRRLMGEISAKEGFVSEATWLAVYQHPSGSIDYCGTVQGIQDDFGRGGIQNLGVTPAHRGQGLGSSLLYHALVGFRRAAVRSVHLEVTAQNASAVRLYRSLGFRHVKTVYKSVEAAMT